jgi:hypothetical protein
MAEALQEADQTACFVFNELQSKSVVQILKSVAIPLICIAISGSCASGVPRSTFRDLSGEEGVRFEFPKCVPM